LVITEAARIDLARAAASRHTADATVVDERRQVGWWINGRVLDGWRQVQRGIVDGRLREAEQRS
jgi:hypothetical protein